MNFKGLILIFIALATLAPFVRAQDDNEGGVAAPAGRYKFSPNAGVAPLNPYTGNATRVVNDLSVASISEVGLNWTRYYNSRGTQAASESFGVAAWRYSFQWGCTISGSTVTIAYPDGTVNAFSPVVSKSNDWQGIPTWQATQSVPDFVYHSGTDYILHTANNQSIYFHYVAAYSNYVAYQIQDSKGNCTLITWAIQVDGAAHITAITENTGHFLHISYQAGAKGNSSGNFAIINNVTTSDGRSVSYTYGYTMNGGYYYYLLRTATYSDGLGSKYTYTSADNVTSYLVTANDVRAVGVPCIQYVYWAAAPFPGFVTTINNGSGEQIVHASWGANGATHCGLSYPDGLQYSYTIGSGGKVTEVVNAQGDTNSYSYVQTPGLMNGTWTTTTTDDLGHSFITVQSNDGQLLMQEAEASKQPEDGGPIYVTTGTWAYDAAGYCTQFCDANGNSTVCTRGTNEWITSITYSDSTSESFTYNTYGQVLTHKRRNGGTEYFGYTSDGLLASSTSAAGMVTLYTSDSNYRVKSITDGKGNTTSFLYNDRGQVTQTTYADGSYKSAAYDNYGNMVSGSNELGNAWTYTYDYMNRVLTKTDPLSRQTTYSYNPNSPGNTAPQLTVLPNNDQIYTTFNYAWGYQVSSVTTGYGTPDAATTSYGFDGAGNLASSTDPMGNVTQTWYDNRNRKIEIQYPGLNFTEFWYDTVGNLITTCQCSSTSSVCETSTNWYNCMNRRYESVDSNNRVTQYTYDPEGKLQTFADPNGKMYTYGYDLDERQTSLQYPDGTVEGECYDPAGNLLAGTNRCGYVQTFTYDCRNRNTGYSWNDGVTPLVISSYDVAGRLLSTSSTNSNVLYGYDSANELWCETEGINGLANATVGYTYNADGTLQTLLYPDRTAVHYIYNSRQQITGIALGGTGGSTIASYTLDLNGRRIGKSLGNGVTSTLGYDANNRLTSILDQTSVSGTLQQFTYGYDDMNRRTYVQRANGLGDAYGYDNYNQLISVQYGVTNPATNPVNPSRTVGYSYDPDGNRLLVNDSVSGTTGYTPNADDQYSSVNGNSLGYDGHGNLSSCAGWTYNYDASNKLIQASGSNSVTLAYDPVGRRVARTENGVTTYSVYGQGWNLLAEYNASGVQQARYVHGANPDELLTKTDSSGNVVYYHTDGLGSVTVLTSTTGALLEQYTYDIYGAATITNASGAPLTSSAYGNRFMFTGREYLASLNLYDYRNRFYSAQLGRFLQPDPISFTGDPYNLYRYCGNNPVNATDPSGQNICYINDGHASYAVSNPYGDGYYICSYQGLGAGYGNLAQMLSAVTYAPGSMTVTPAQSLSSIPASEITEIQTSTGQDSQALSFAQNMQQNGAPGYNYFVNNCANVAGEGIAAGLNNSSLFNLGPLTSPNDVGLSIAAYQWLNPWSAPSVTVDSVNTIMSQAGNVFTLWSDSDPGISSGVGSINFNSNLFATNDNFGLGAFANAGGNPFTIGQTPSGAPGPAPIVKGGDDDDDDDDDYDDYDDDDDDDTSMVAPIIEQGYICLERWGGRSGAWTTVISPFV